MSFNIKDKLEYLSCLISPKRFTKAAFGFTPDDNQLGVMTRTDAEQLIVWNRQYGKSATLAALCLHTAIFQPGSLILIAAQKKDIAQEMIRKAKLGARILNAGMYPKATNDNAGSLELSNGSRILSVSGSDGGPRGYSVNLAIVDEASRVPEEYYQALMPTQATIKKPKFIALTTPKGKIGWFWNKWSKEKAPFKQLLTYKDCPRISEAFIEKERSRLPDHIFRQEYLCEFIDPDSSFFDYDDFMRCITPDVKTLGLRMV